MRSKDDNVVVQKSYAFSLRCVRLYKYLCSRDGNYIIGKQLLRSGTSIGANVREALRAQTRPDFITKLNVALKEASETEYWIELLRDSDYISSSQAESMLADCVELLKILTSIVKKSKENSDTIRIKN
ncbi:four helix bundle protein [uncultured Prevotella sp.]|uniref:four helix bundle protein n=1 Tax=Xylanibacter rarus TaxID=1676614 RepID=UPI00265D22DC|nr:four helix bundle protein [uncultured Prevotella sp.]